MDYYEILNVAHSATNDEIKKAYRQLALKYHPDRNPGDENAVMNFKKVQEAYDVLSDTQKRTEYDHKGYVGGKNPFYEAPKKTYENRDDSFVQSASRRYKADKSELDKIQQQFFGGGELQGRNILIHLLLSTQELRNGTIKEVKWKKGVKCKTCDGYGAAGFKNSEFVKCKACKGTGNVTQIPGKQGAMYPKCDFCDGSGFLDMFCKDCKGTGITTDMFIEEMIIEVPSGTPSGHQIVIRGRGEPGSKGGIAGNLHVIIIEQNPSQVLN